MTTVFLLSSLCGCTFDPADFMPEVFGLKKNSTVEEYAPRERQFNIDESYAGMKIEEADQEVISWLCATYAIQSSVNGLDLTIVGGMERGDDNIEFLTNGLEIGWGIVDRKSALETIDTLLEDDRVTDSWNSSRAMQLLAQCYSIGYIEFDEYMEYAIPLGRIIQENYSSWESFGDDYLKGYTDWMNSRKNPDESQIEERKNVHEFFLEQNTKAKIGPYSVDFSLELQ